MNQSIITLNQYQDEPQTNLSKNNPNQASNTSISRGDRAKSQILNRQVSTVSQTTTTSNIVEYNINRRVGL